MREEHRPVIWKGTPLSAGGNRHEGMGGPAGCRNRLVGITSHSGFLSESSAERAIRAVGLKKVVPVKQPLWRMKTECKLGQGKGELNNLQVL